MSNILLTLLLVVNFVVLACLLFGMAQIARTYRQFRVFITPEAEGKPSPLANTTQVIADMVGRSICASLKTTFMGKQSAAIRGESAVEGDIAQDIAAASPIGAVLESFPSLKKTLRKNPALLDLALSAIAKRGNAGSVSVPSNGNSPKFKF